MTRTAIIAALPGELKPFVRGWARHRSNGVNLWRHALADGELVAACVGAGQPAATRAFAEIEKSGPISIAISTGWAGALCDHLQSGRAYPVSAVLDARTGERFPTASTTEGHLLVTTPTVAAEPEKLRLAATYSAALVDMEAAAIARLAQMRQIPFFCIKGVSDALHDDLPDFNRFIAPNGQLQLARLVLFSFLHPWYWPPLIRMGENSRKASQSIAESLLDLLDERGQIRERNGYPIHKR